MKYFIVFFQVVAVLALLCTTIVVTTTLTARNVNNHLDTVFAQAVKNGARTTEQAQRLFEQVDNICRALKAQDSNINCEGPQPTLKPIP